MLLLFIPGPLLIIGAISLWCQAGGGLYWVTAAVAMGFASATGNAWVLLVEIKVSRGGGTQRAPASIAYSGIQVPPNQKPQPGPLPAGIGVTC